MKKFLVVLLVALFLPLAMVVSLQQPVDAASALLVVTDTPTPPSTDTPVPSDTPTSTPDTPPSETPTGTPPIVTTTSTPPTPSNPTETPGPDETPISTPDAIPALGTGPSVATMTIFGLILFVMFVFLSIGWIRVWKGYEK